MAALRSGMAMLGRRGCGRFAPSSASSMGRKGVEINQVFRPAPPAVRPASSVRDLESWRRFSTVGGELKDKAGSFLRLWQWAKHRVENADSVTKTRVFCAYALVAMGTPTLYMMNNVRNWVLSRSRQE